MKKLMVLAVLLLVGAASWAQGATGQWLHDHWSTYKKILTEAGTGHGPSMALAVEGTTYMGFVIGAATGHVYMGWLHLANTSYGQWFEIVGKYLDDHPEKWNLDADNSVYWALYAFWPGKVAAPSGYKQGG